MAEVIDGDERAGSDTALDPPTGIDSRAITVRGVHHPYAVSASLTCLTLASAPDLRVFGIRENGRITRSLRSVTQTWSNRWTRPAVGPMRPVHRHRQVGPDNTSPAPGLIAGAGDVSHRSSFG